MSKLSLHQRIACLIAGVLMLSLLTHCARNAPTAATGDWVGHGRDAAEQRFSPLTEINAENVQRLGLVWSLDLPGENALPATPLAVDGVVYFSGGLGAVYAVDAVVGRILWKYDPETNRETPRDARKVFANNRGVAWWDGKLYVATKDGRMIALDTKTGRPVWTTQFLMAGDRSASSGAPRAFNGKIIIGNSGAELGARGYVTTLDANTGKVLWRFYTVPGNPAVDFDETTQIAAKSWSGEWWKYGGGGTPWNGITYDVEFNQILVGTGNGGPWAGEFRRKQGDDNLFLASVVALDADTGKYKWHYQYNPGEVWDWKATSDIILADLKIADQPRKVLMQAPSNGFFYVIDRSNGKLIAAEKIGKVNWAERIDLETGRPVERPGIRRENGPVVLYPGYWGAHSWQAASFNPITGLIYIPYMQLGMKTYAPPFGTGDVTADPTRLQLRLGVISEAYIDPADPMDGKGSLLAWNPVTQKLQWRVDYPFYWNAGTMTTAGKVVFQGTNTGKFFAYDATNGKQLWSFDAKLGIIAPPITYIAKGRQYVSLLVGYGAGAGQGGPGLNQGWKYGLQPRRLLTFALDGNATLPDTPPADFTIKPLDDPAMTLEPASVARGAKLYVYMVCTGCHGSEAQATGGAPDLRESGIAFNRQVFGEVLRDGLLIAKGMPRYDDLNDQDLDDLYHYIRSQARNYRVSHATASVK